MYPTFTLIGDPVVYPNDRSLISFNCQAHAMPKTRGIRVEARLTSCLQAMNRLLLDRLLFALDQRRSYHEHQEGAQVDPDQIGPRGSGRCPVGSDTTAEGARRNFARDVTSVGRLRISSWKRNLDQTDIQVDVPRTSSDASKTK